MDGSHKGGMDMRKSMALPKRYWPIHLRVGVLAAGLVLSGLWFNNYVNTQIKPTLMELAEYEARAVTTKAIQTAVQETLAENPTFSESLCQVTEDYVQMDMAMASAMQVALTEAIRTSMESLPQHSYEIPFGSLTGNSLLSGHGPGWKVELQPEGYVQSAWEDTTESLSINTTRYSATLCLWVTVNMILDGRTETLTVTQDIPLCSLLLQGNTPETYASVSD